MIVAVEVIAVHDSKGNIKPYRVRLEAYEETIVIDKIKIKGINKSKDKIEYLSEIIIGEMIKNCKIIFYINETKWFLDI